MSFDGLMYLGNDSPNAQGITWARSDTGYTQGIGARNMEVLLVYIRAIANEEEEIPSPNTIE